MSLEPSENGMQRVGGGGCRCWILSCRQRMGQGGGPNLLSRDPLCLSPARKHMAREPREVGHRGQPLGHRAG